MFYGREYELKKLERLYSSNNFEMVVIYGRRRVGKTTLINEFCKNKKTIFFSALESTLKENLSAFSSSVFSYSMPGLSANPDFKSFTEAFEYIEEISENKRLILVIDEYPYLASSDKSISSLIQNTIDMKFKNTKLFMILCGSSMSFMEYQVLGYKSPLYGRRTAQFKILPFDYYDTAKWVPNYNFDDKALLYGITGGVPLYIEKFKDSVPLTENIKENIFDKSAFLFEEPSNLLKQELRELQTYNAIISAIANGSSKLSEIASKVQIESSLCVKYINNLISLGIIKKETPIAGKIAKKTIYLISDNLFRFWYRFVPPNMAAIVSGKIENSYQKSIEPFLSDYTGLVFEEMCKDYLLFHCEYLPFDIGNIGQWWGNNPLKKQQEQIDIVLISSDKKAAMFGECKFRNEKVGEEILNKLIEKTSLFTEFKPKHYCLFSKAGFTNSLIERSKKEGILLFDIEKIYR
ncbi:ATP-binding protein [Herbivorax sp. ANBcel31]|uniref:ATP-binding protein n=1 Tax=Herbivorax sp. ANBcel31 TaxID=3069754 RepID=UPI0027B5F253|nr:ATP-binding protein [Herbivorax sp. ANBcel31]MDQ2088045.1 ATP-binding protein [Herbivorax sp. ANBcel31]